MSQVASIGSVISGSGGVGGGGGGVIEQSTANDAVRAGAPGVRGDFDLRRGPKHGYEINRSMEHVLGGVRVTNSQLYPPLKRFEEMGAVTREVIPQTGKPDRHQYRLTSLGEEIMHDLLVDDSPEILARDREFYVRAAHVELMSSEERMVVLAARKGALTRRQARVAGWAGGPWPQRVGRLRGHLLAAELAIIEEWMAEERIQGEDTDTQDEE